MKDFNWGIIIAKAIEVLLPVLMMFLIWLVKRIGSYFGEKIKNSQLKNIYGWLNKEIVASLTRLKDDVKLKEELVKAWEDGQLTHEEKELIIKLVKHDVMSMLPDGLINEMKYLLGDIEKYVEKQIKLFFSAELQEKSLNQQ